MGFDTNLYICRNNAKHRKRIHSVCNCFATCG